MLRLATSSRWWALGGSSSSRRPWPAAFVAASIVCGNARSLCESSRPLSRSGRVCTLSLLGTIIGIMTEGLVPAKDYGIDDMTPNMAKSEYDIW